MKLINSRKLEDLHPYVKSKCEKFIAACHDHEIDIIITSTYRDLESQAALYAQGRTTPGNIVTKAKPGFSYHNYRIAFDFVPIVCGKAAWDDIELFKKCGVLAESIGLEWAGRWVSFKEYAHCQYTNGLSLQDLKEGKIL